MLECWTARPQCHSLCTALGLQFKDYWYAEAPLYPVFPNTGIYNRKDKAIKPLEFCPVLSVLYFTCNVTKQWFTFGSKGGWIYAFTQYVFDIAVQYQISYQQ